jgi:hypothetical protein
VQVEFGNGKALDAWMYSFVGRTEGRPAVHLPAHINTQPRGDKQRAADRRPRAREGNALRKPARLEHRAASAA